METGVSSPFSQKPPTGSCPEPAESSSPSIPISVRSSLILPCHIFLGLPSGLLLSGLPTKTLKTPFPSPCVPNILSTLPSSFNHPNNIRRRIRAVNFIIMQLYPRSVCLHFRSNILLNTLLKNPQSMFLPQSERPIFEPTQYNWQNYSFEYFNLQVFWYETGRQKILERILAIIPWI